MGIIIQKGEAKMTALTMGMICALSGIIGYCIAQIILHFIHGSDKRKKQYKEMCRAYAYSVVRKRRIIKQNRQATWRAFGNGKI